MSRVIHSIKMWAVALFLLLIQFVPAVGVGYYLSLGNDSLVAVSLALHCLMMFVFVRIFVAVVTGYAQRIVEERLALIRAMLEHSKHPHNTE